MSPTEFWQQVYLNAIRSGKWNDVSAVNIADAAVRQFKERHWMPLPDPPSLTSNPKGE